MKNTLKDSEVAPSLKFYYVKTAVLWLAQEGPIDRWTGVTTGVHLVLDGLERHLRVGQMPCFFWPAINLVSGLSPIQQSNMISTVQLIRRQALCLFIGA